MIDLHRAIAQEINKLFGCHGFTVDSDDDYVVIDTDVEKVHIILIVKNMVYWGTPYSAGDLLIHDERNRAWNYSGRYLTIGSILVDDPIDTVIFAMSAHIYQKPMRKKNASAQNKTH